MNDDFFGGNIIDSRCVPTSSPGRFRRVLLITVSLASIATVGLWLLYEAVVGRPAHPYSVNELEAKLRVALPFGSSREQVLVWINAEGLSARSEVISPEDPASMLLGSRVGIPGEHLGWMVSAMIHDTSRDLISRSNIRLDWYFDRSGKLIKVDVRDEYVGL